MNVCFVLENTDEINTFLIIIINKIPRKKLYREINNTFRPHQFNFVLQTKPSLLLTEDQRKGDKFSFEKERDREDLRKNGLLVVYQLCIFHRCLDVTIAV